MKLNITNKTDNILLHRLNVEGTISFEGVTPSNNDLRKKLTSELKKDTNLIVIKNIHTSFSQQNAKFLAFVYENAEAKNKIEMDTKHLRKKAKEDKQKADAEVVQKAEAKAKEKEDKEEGE